MSMLTTGLCSNKLGVSFLPGPTPPSTALLMCCRFRFGGCEEQSDLQLPREGPEFPSTGQAGLPSSLVPELLA